MHRFLDDIQDHWPLVLFGLGAASGFILWIWGKLVVSPKALRDCKDEVTLKFSKEVKVYVKDNSSEHSKIYDKMENNHKEVMQAFIDHLRNDN